MTEEEFYNLSDEEAEAAFRAAKAEMGSPEVGEEFDGENIKDEMEMEEEIGEPEDGMETDEEEEVNDLEQPEEDSDDDTSSETDDDEVEEEDTTDTDEDDLDGDSEEEEEKPAENAEETKVEEQPVKMHTFKANGKEYNFTDDEVKNQFPKIFGQAMDYTKKMQAIKPWRKTIDAIESAELGHDDVNLMISALKGDKGAINEVIKRTGVDTLELDPEIDMYVAKDYGRDDSTLAIKDVVDEISVDQEYNTTHRILSKEWDETSWNEMSKDPTLIKLLHTDVKTGMYNKVQPIAEKLKVYGGATKSDLEYYKEAAGVYFNQQGQEQERLAKAEREKVNRDAELAEKAKITEVKAKQEKAKTVKQESKKRKAAAPTKKAVGTKRSIDYLDDSDEAFEEWYSKIQDL